MRLFRHFSDLPSEVRGSAAAIGNFDGVHRGHLAVIEDARREARRLGCPLSVLTFEPHPRSFFQPDAPPFRLTPFRTKARLLEEAGVEVLFSLAFDATLASLTAEAFAERVLVAGLDLRHASIGYNFAFGKGRAGDAATLLEFGLARGFGVTPVGPALGPNGMAYSSSRARALIAEGKVADAAQILGRPWEVDGRVETGQRLGNTIGFPTANLKLGEHVRPATGVYAVQCAVEDSNRWHDGAANFGRRPTVGGTDERLEAHLFDFSGDLYGKHLRVRFIERLRAERKFDGLDALKAQIAEDCRQARAILAREPTGQKTPVPKTMERA